MCVEGGSHLHNGRHAAVLCSGQRPEYGPVNRRRAICFPALGHPVEARNTELIQGKRRRQGREFPTAGVWRTGAAPQSPNAALPILPNEGRLAELNGIGLCPALEPAPTE